jgi:alpha/beta superfamily hydrolase
LPYSNDEVEMSTINAIAPDLPSFLASAEKDAVSQFQAELAKASAARTYQKRVVSAAHFHNAGADAACNGAAPFYNAPHTGEDA